MISLATPIVQGGMGIGVSLGRLAGTIARFGGMGTISAIHPGYRVPKFEEDRLAADVRAIHEEVAKARDIAQGNGLIAVNIMVAITEFENMVKASVEAGADALVCGAGLPLKLPELVGDSDIKLIPIVSGVRAAQLIMRAWGRHYGRRPDAFVLEGPLAGGHLGFKLEELKNPVPLLSMVKEFSAWLKKDQLDIPLIVAGGIEPEDVPALRDAGADAIQLGTAFIATEECDAHPIFKDQIIRATESIIIQSPVGMPGRALFTPLQERLRNVDRIPSLCCTNCLKPCDPRTTVYCIKDALLASARGVLERGLFFAGAGVGKFSKIVSVGDRIAQYLERG